MLKIHPIFTNYAADKNGNCYSIKSGRKLNATISKTGYMRIGLYNDNKSNCKYTLHKFVYECFNGIINLSTHTGEGLTINHIDENKSNNSIDNLEIMTLRKNRQYSCKNKTSIFTGVVFDKRRNKFQSKIKLYGKTIHLGMFNDEYDAAKAYDDKYEMVFNLRPNYTKNKI